MEVSCKHTRHGKCRLRRAFKANGGQERVEQMLKFWVINAGKFKRQKSHKDMPLPKHFPSFEELNNAEFSNKFPFDGKRGRKRKLGE